MKKPLAVAATLLIAAAPADNTALLARFANDLLIHQDPAAAFAVAAPDMIQHNPAARDGRDNAVALTTPLFTKPGAKFTPLHLLADGDLIFLHYHGQLAPGAGASVAELYRVHAGRLVEHWDAFQPSRAPAEPAAAAVVSGGENRALIEDFASTLYGRRDVRRAFGRDVAAGLVDHAGGTAGREATVAQLSPMFADPAEHYTVAHVLAAGAYGVIHVHAVNDRTHTDAVVFDVVRVAGGRIVEIWPIIQVVKASGPF